MHVTNVGIDGMMCGQCKSHVSSLLSKIKGALTVKANPFKKRASICSPDSISKEQVEEALKESGYRVLSYESHQEEKEPFLYRMKLKPIGNRSKNKTYLWPFQFGFPKERGYFRRIFRN